MLPCLTAAVVQRVERLTLARQCPTLLTLLKSFPLTLSLNEPTFKDLVVVYRWVSCAVSPVSLGLRVLGAGGRLCCPGVTSCQHAACGGMCLTSPISTST